MSGTGSGRIYIGMVLPWNIKQREGSNKHHSTADGHDPEHSPVPAFFSCLQIDHAQDRSQERIGRPWKDRKQGSMHQVDVVGKRKGKIIPSVDLINKGSGKNNHQTQHKQNVHEDPFAPDYKREDKCKEQRQGYQLQDIAAEKSKERLFAHPQHLLKRPCRQVQPESDSKNKKESPDLKP